jgi:hypothetical protein
VTILVSAIFVAASSILIQVINGDTDG